MQLFHWKMIFKRCCFFTYLIALEGNLIVICSWWHLSCSFWNLFCNLLVMTFISDSNRWTCRNCSVSSNITSSSLRPCDFKMGRTLNSLQTFRCSYKFNMRYIPSFWFDYYIILAHLVCSYCCLMIEILYGLLLC